MMVGGTTITALVQLLYTSLASSPPAARAGGGVGEVLMGGHLINATAAALELWVHPTAGVDGGNAGTDHGQPLAHWPRRSSGFAQRSRATICIERR